MLSVPKISIITISFNAEEFIERTIKSIIAQSYPDIEYIIIDGASKDGTVDIIKKYEKNISLWVSEPDKNLYDAMNKGLERATGDYVVFMNAGDRIHDKDSLAKLMEGVTDEDLVYSKAEVIDEEGNRRPWHKKTPPPSEISAKSFLNGSVVCHHCMVVKRSIAPFYKLEPWKIANDIEWSIRVMKNVRTTHFWDGTFCLFLEGGLSDANRIAAVKERFNIAVLHFGYFSAILEQIKIGFQVIKRGRIS